MKIHIDYTFDYLKELLTNTDKLTSMNDFIPNYDSNKKNDYKDLDVVTDIKTDLDNMAKNAISEIQSLDRVANVKANGSNQYGMSEYIHIKFTKPTKEDIHRVDSYLNICKGAYGCVIRFSDHKSKRFKRNTKREFNSHNYDINLIGKTFDEAFALAVNYVKQHIAEIEKLEDMWEKKEPKAKIKKEYDKYFSDDALKKAFQQHGTQYTEAYTMDMLSVLLYPDVQDELKRVRVDIEDIIQMLESQINFKNLNYRDILQIVSDCLNANILDYTYNDFFDFEMLADDVESQID